MDMLLMEANRIGSRIIREATDDLIEHTREMMAEDRRHKQAMEKIEQERIRLEQEGIEIKEQNEKNEEFRLWVNAYIDEKNSLKEQVNTTAPRTLSGRNYSKYIHLKKGVCEKVKESIKKAHQVVKISVDEIYDSENLQVNHKQGFFSTILSDKKNKMIEGTHNE